MPRELQTIAFCSDLEKSGYHYNIWHHDPYSGAKANIAASGHLVSADAIQVTCPMPNDFWYVDTAENGQEAVSNKRIFLSHFGYNKSILLLCFLNVQRYAYNLNIIQ